MPRPGPRSARRAFDLAAPDLDNSRGARHYIDAAAIVPADKVDESVSRTQEYAYDDWAMAHARATRPARTTTPIACVKRSAQLPQRASIPRSASRGPRFADGSWWTPYDPIQLGHMPKR